MAAVLAPRCTSVRSVGRHAAVRVPDAELLTSEAVANAVQHAVTEHITVTVIDVGHAVRVFVQDDDPTPPSWWSRIPPRWAVTACT